MLADSSAIVEPTSFIIPLVQLDQQNTSEIWTGSQLVQTAVDLARRVTNLAEIKRFECDVSANGPKGFSIVATSRMGDWRGRQIRFDGHQDENGGISMSVFGGATELRYPIRSLTEVDEAIGKVKSADLANRRETSR